MSGLEVVGSIASVAQLAGTVYTISKTLYEVGNALSNAPSDIKDLAGDLERFSEELHLYARLLDKKHYDDQFHRLTARIIGECATICTKIDRVLRKLRSGKLWARVKWLYKEKEILKLLTRLRDLKFSLLSVLQLMKYLKADQEIDAIGGPNRSLLQVSKEEGLSKETIAQVEATRKKLAGITIAQEHDSSRSGPKEKPESLSNDEPSLIAGTEEGYVSQSTETLSSQTLTANSVAESVPGTKDSGILSDDASSIYVAAFALPKNSLMQNSNTSVQSFYSAFSHFDPGTENARLSTTDSSAFRTPDGTQSQQTDDLHKRIDNDNVNLHLGLKADFVTSAMKHFGMSKEAADAWATASVTRIDLPPPSAMIPSDGASTDFSKPSCSLLSVEDAFSLPQDQHSGDPLPRATNTNMTIITDSAQPSSPDRENDPNELERLRHLHHSNSSSKKKSYSYKLNKPSEKGEHSDWTNVSDLEERRRVQNRIAQRMFRKKAKEAKERQEHGAENRSHAGHSYSAPDPDEIWIDDELTGLPWGSLSLRHVVSKGKAKESRSRRGSEEKRNSYEWPEPAYEEKDAYYEADSTDSTAYQAYYDYAGISYSSNCVEESSHSVLEPTKPRTLLKKRGPGSDSYQPRTYSRSHVQLPNEGNSGNLSSSAPTVADPKSMPIQSSDAPEDALKLIDLSEKLRCERKERIREIERERERIEEKDHERDEWERFERRKERENPAPYDDERILEREIIYEGGRRRGPPPRRGGTLPKPLVDVISRHSINPDLASKSADKLSVVTGGSYETVPTSPRGTQWKRSGDHRIMESFFDRAPDFSNIPPTGVAPDNQFTMPETRGINFGVPSGRETNSQTNKITPVGEEVSRQLMGLGSLDSLDIGWNGLANSSKSMEPDQASSRASTTYSDHSPEGAAIESIEERMAVENKDDEEPNDNVATHLPPQSPTRDETMITFESPRPLSPSYVHSHLLDSANVPRLLKSSERLHSPPVEPAGIFTGANFTLSDFWETDYEDFDNDSNSVIRPHQYEDAESDRAQSVDPLAQDPASKGQQSPDSLACGAERMESSDDESWTRMMKAEKRRKRRNLSTVHKRTFAQSIGSSTEDEDVQPIFEGANEAGSSARKLRRKVGDREGLIFDDPPLRTEESEELESLEEAEESTGEGQKIDRDLFYASDLDLGLDLGAEPSQHLHVANGNLHEQPSKVVRNGLHTSPPHLPTTKVKTPELRLQTPTSPAFLSAPHPPPPMVDFLNSSATSYHNHPLPPSAHQTKRQRFDNPSTYPGQGQPRISRMAGMSFIAPKSRVPELKFTLEDDQLLVDLKENQKFTWEQIAEFYPGRSSGTMQIRYSELDAKRTQRTEETSISSAFERDNERTPPIFEFPKFGSMAIPRCRRTDGNAAHESNPGSFRIPHGSSLHEDGSRITTSTMPMMKPNSRIPVPPPIPPPKYFSYLQPNSQGRGDDGEYTMPAQSPGKEPPDRDTNTTMKYRLPGPPPRRPVLGSSHDIAASSMYQSHESDGRLKQSVDEIDRAKHSLQNNENVSERFTGSDPPLCATRRMRNTSSYTADTMKRSDGGHASGSRSGQFSYTFSPVVRHSLSSVQAAKSLNMSDGSAIADSPGNGYQSASKNNLTDLDTVKTPSKLVGAHRPPGARGTTTPLHFKREDEIGAANSNSTGAANVGETSTPKPGSSMITEESEYDTTANRSTEISYSAESISSSEPQLKELWWRAVAKCRLQEEDLNISAKQEENKLLPDGHSFQSCVIDDPMTASSSSNETINPISAIFGNSLRYLKKLWLEAVRSHSLIANSRNAMTANTDADMARTAAASLERWLWNLGDIQNGTPLHRISEILKVMRSTLDFKVGGLIWTCFCQVIITSLENRPGEDKEELQNNTFTHLADLATLIARYNVMESMYHDWPGMTLEKQYEDSLINLCVIVLRYLNEVQMESWSIYDDSLKYYAARIAEADAACRGFTVTIVPDAVQRDRDRGTKRTMEDLEEQEDSDEESDYSDSTLVAYEGKEASRKLSSNAKRVKV